ncbi:hypothetical protein NL676_026160 [Syzygium grande]|nr:hypothetical protein NL676_026160 [Syzygium grande]
MTCLSSTGTGSSRSTRVSPSPVGTEQLRGLTARLVNIGFEVAAFGDFNVYLRGLLSSQEAKLTSLEKERDCTFDMTCEMFLAAAQGEQENSHMDSHLKDFVTAIWR